MDPQEMVTQAQERFAKIRRDPEKALFSEYKGVSPSGAVTVWVDMMGKLVRVHLAPNTMYEGGEPWLTTEIMAAHEAAKRAAETLDFSMADLVQELDNALQLKQRVTAAPEATPARERDSGRHPDDDDSFENRSHLR
ncbi:MAG: YbaB/EbfC family nucleoid-associated protein [Umezawaea sp.]